MKSFFLSFTFSKENRDKLQKEIWVKYKGDLVAHTDFALKLLHIFLAKSISRGTFTCNMAGTRLVGNNA